MVRSSSGGITSRGSWPGLSDTDQGSPARLGESGAESKSQIMRIKSAIRELVVRVARSCDELLIRRYKADPFCLSPLASEEEYRAIHDEARRLEFGEVDAFEAATGFKIDEEWFETLALLTQVTKKSSAVKYPHGRLLYSGLRQYIRASGETSPTILETGTARGFSAMCLGKAMMDEGVGGKVVSLDLLPDDAEIFWNCIADCDGKKKTRRELLAPYKELADRYLICMSGDSGLQLERLGIGRVHFANLDGAHIYENVIAEATFVAKRQKKGDVIFFDDYNASEFPGVVEAADEIVQRYGYETRVVELTDDARVMFATKS